jgi:hypothetical protein
VVADPVLKGFERYPPRRVQGLVPREPREGHEDPDSSTPSAGGPDTN